MIFLPYYGVSFFCRITVFHFFRRITGNRVNRQICRNAFLPYHCQPWNAVTELEIKPPGIFRIVFWTLNNFKFFVFCQNWDTCYCSCTCWQMQYICLMRNRLVLQKLLDHFFENNPLILSIIIWSLKLFILIISPQIV